MKVFRNFLFLSMLSILFSNQARAEECHIPSEQKDLAIKLTIADSRLKKSDSIVFGHPEIGFFRAPLRREPDGKVKFSFIPVTYKLPTYFYLAQDGLSFQKTFRSEFNCFSRPVKRTGSLSHPFHFLSWVVRSLSGHQVYFPAIVNRIGELVWMNAGATGTLGENYHYSAREVPGGLIVLSQFQTSTVMKFQFEDQSTWRYRIVDQVPKIHIHHSFAMVDPKTLAILITKNKKVSIFDDYLFNFRSLFEITKLFFLGPRIFMGSELALFNLETKEIRPIFSSFDHFSTKLDQVWDYKYENSDDPFLARKGADAVLFAHPEMPGVEPAHVDWSHENAVDYDPALGFLITSRSMNSLTLLSPEGEFLGNVGITDRATWKWPAGNVPFSHPHSGRFFGDSILFFDNATPFEGKKSSPLSRILVFKIPKKGETNLQITKEIQIPGPISYDRGSVYSDDHNRIVALVTRSPRHPIAIQEYTVSDGKKVAELEFTWPFEKRSQEAVPLHSLGFPETAKPNGSSGYRKIDEKKLAWKFLNTWSTPIEGDIY